MLSMMTFMFSLSLFLMLKETWILFFLFLSLLFFRALYLSFSFHFMSKNLYLSLDIYSYLLLVLTIWIVFLSVFSSFFIIFSKNGTMFLFLFNTLNFILVICFLSSNMFFFFFLFESSLIPIFYIITGWGYKIERLKSGLYMFFYTLFGSFPMMMMIFFIMKINNCLNFYFLENTSFSSLIYIVSILAFLIKMPMYFVHSWLPKAHVEAPVSGSMILAGILLKLGGYGMFRFMFMYNFFLLFSNLFIYLSIWGGMISGFLCFRQIDVKCLIAFSSVSHMSIVILGLLFFSKMSILGSFLMMFSHGLSSSGLFYMFNLIYERSGTRSIFMNKGLVSIFPSFSMLWFFFCSCNMAAPPSLNLLSEILLLNSAISLDFLIVFIFMMICFMSGAYNLFLYSFLCHGKINSLMIYFNSLKVRENLISLMHLIPLNLLFLKLEMFN